MISAQEIEAINFHNCGSHSISSWTLPAKLGLKEVDDGAKVIQQVSTEPGGASSPLTVTFSSKCYLLEFARETETIETHIETNTQGGQVAPLVRV